MNLLILIISFELICVKIDMAVMDFRHNIMQVDVYFGEIKYFKTEQTIGYSVGDFFSKSFVFHLKLYCDFKFKICASRHSCGFTLILSI